MFGENLVLPLLYDKKQKYERHVLEKNQKYVIIRRQLCVGGENRPSDFVSMQLCGTPLSPEKYEIKESFSEIMKEKIKHIILTGCAINSAAVLLLCAAANLFSIDGFAPKFSTVLMVLIFSFAVSFANTLQKFKRLSLILRIIIHYALLGAAFYVIFILWSGFASKGRLSFLLMCAYTVIYAVIMSVIFGVERIRQRKKSEKENKYETQF